MSEENKKNKAWKPYERELVFCCGVIESSKEVRQKIANLLGRKLEHINSENQNFKKILNYDFSETGKTATIRQEIAKAFLINKRYDVNLARSCIVEAIGEFNEIPKEEYLTIACFCAIVRPLVEIKEVIAAYFDKPVASFNVDVTRFNMLLKERKIDLVNLSTPDSAKIDILENIKANYTHKEIKTKLLEKLKEINPSKEWDMSDLHGVYKWLSLQGFSKATERYKSLRSRCFDRLLLESFFDFYLLNSNTGLRFLAKHETIDDSEYEKLISENMNIIFKQDFDFEKMAKADLIELGKKVSSPMRMFFNNMKNVRIRNHLFDKWKSHYEVQIKESKKIYNNEFFKVLDPEYFAKEIFGKNEHDRECIYCGLTESMTQKLREGGQLFTKKDYSKGKSMEIDQKDAYRGYTPDNIVLACYWCNNAKTDEFDFEEWRKMGLIMKEIWSNRYLKMFKE